VIGIDTNILVRFLVRDDTKQANKVYRIFKNAEDNNSAMFVSTLVVLELLWVLESVYKVDRLDILDSISQMMLMPALQFENKGVIQSFIPAARTSTFDLSDLLIAHTAKNDGCELVLTFDKKASKYEYFELI
jgi:predicted nucleic-acid-binding protein